MFEFFLKYPRMVYEQGELILAREWPLWIALAALLVAALVIGALLVLRRRAMPAWQLAAIGVLQLAMVALVLLVIWQPAILTEQLRAGDNVVSLMLDVSESMNYGEGDLPRMQTALAIARGGVMERIGEEYTVQRVVFSGQARQVSSYEALPPPQKSTRLGDSLKEVLGMSRVTPLGAVILITDGADNDGALTQDQLAEIARYDVPVHTIGIGRDRIDEDLELQSVNLPERALPGTLLSARVAVRHDRPGTARIKVTDGDRLVTAKELQLEPGTDVTTAWVDVPVADAGYRALRFTLDPWPGEQVMENNTRSRVVEVREEKYRVLYIEGEPRWEYKFIRRALNDDPSVELVSLLRVSQNKFYRQGVNDPAELEEGFPLERPDLFRYHALIIGSIEAASFTPAQQQMIHDFVSERGGSLMMIAGPNGLGRGGWENSSISELLPARLDPGDSDFVREKTRVALTPAGRFAPMLKLSEDPAQNAKLWQELPEIADYQRIGALKPAATRLLDAVFPDGNRPLLVSQPYGKGTSYILASGGTWRWQMGLPVKDQRHETFWRQLLRELVINSPERFRLSSHLSGDRVRVNAEYRDESYEPEQGMRLTAVVSPESGQAMSMDLHPSQEYPGLMTGEFSADRSGLYTVEVISRRGGEPVDSARHAFQHDAGKAEAFSLRQNRTLLEQLAAATGGRHWEPGGLEGLPEAIRFSAAGITEDRIRPLWDAPLFFLLLFGLKAAEWLLRRRWKAI